MTTTRAMLVVGALALVACTPKELPVDANAVHKAVADYISEHSTSPPPLAQLNKFYLESRKLNKTEQKRFREVYQRAVDLHAPVTKDKRSQRSVIDFLVRRAAAAEPPAASGDTNAVTSQNPTYLAFALYSSDAFDSASIGGEDNLDRLARSFMVGRPDLERAVYECLTQDKNEIYKKAAAIVEANLASADAASPEQFAVSTLLPYLTLVVIGNNLAEKLDAPVAAAFAKKFGADAKETLPALVQEFRAFLKGELFDTLVLLHVNEALKKQSLWLFVQEGHASIYKLLPQKIEVGGKGLQRVLAMQRLGVSLIPVSNGLSIYQDPDVMLVVDALQRRQLEVADAIGQNKRFLMFSKYAIETWRELELPLDEAKAYTAVDGLVRRSFDKQSPDQVAAALFRSAAVHETKRKWDEAGADAKDWVAMDFEVAASLPELALGPVPEYSLIFVIDRLQEFMADQTRAAEGARLSEAGMAQLRDLLKRNWQLALDAAGGQKDSKAVREAAREMYKNYRAANGKPLTDIEAYRNEVYAKAIERAQPFRP